MRNSYLLAILSGLLMALAWPTYGIPLLAFIGFVPLLLAEKHIRESDRKRRGAKVFLSSYIAFLIWNSITTWWIWYSTPFGMFFAILVNSLLMALVFQLYHFVARRLPSKIHLIFLPVIWMAFEKFHLNWDFSWPWLNLGNVFSEYTTWIQWYEFTGTFGGALWIWIINIGVFKTIIHYKETKTRSVLTKGIARNVLMIAIPIILSLFLLNNYEESTEKVEVTLLQPNIDPYTEKYGIPNVQMAQQLIELAKQNVTNNTDYVFAPETALPRDLSIDDFDESQEKHMLQQFVKKYPKLQFVTGASFFRLYPQKEKPTPTANETPRGDWYDIYNAAVQIGKSPSTPKYIKSKLVVGVENFPFKNILKPLLGDIMIDLGGIVASRATQKERSVFNSNNGNFAAAPIICYESIYGEFVTDYVKNGANFLAIITNDAWWSDTQGHQQHLSYARLRAIETRKSVVRSANTGISAFINEKGEVEKSLAYNVKGAISGAATINSKETFYVKYGDYIARLSVLIAGITLLFAIAKKKG
ncbi:apolipoprotein N-acyltransferase [Galbibacter sp. EGI 63066]|uniref:apolipoprotein N-acyltransferase n=1 Tax=Galbibacter sp. EGI 63066 TaxID=2993559 RepID=UPI0022499B3B|nr:apolipoprotein N-acyltransferase [Galbibacter sp. EGI 63066]MCX2680222.1 apolipoprotein N-acyltransferase [Galbibacter sp. EGI 63066]